MKAIHSNEVHTVAALIVYWRIGDATLCISLECIYIAKNDTRTFQCHVQYEQIFNYISRFTTQQIYRVCMFTGNGVVSGSTLINKNDQDGNSGRRNLAHSSGLFRRKTAKSILSTEILILRFQGEALYIFAIRFSLFWDLTRGRLVVINVSEWHMCHLQGSNCLHIDLSGHLFLSGVRVETPHTFTALPCVPHNPPVLSSITVEGNKALRLVLWRLLQSVATFSF